MSTSDEDPFAAVSTTVEEAMEYLKSEILEYFQNNPPDDAHKQVDQDTVRAQVVAQIQQMSNVPAQAANAHATAPKQHKPGAPKHRGQKKAAPPHTAPPQPHPTAAPQTSPSAHAPAQPAAAPHAAPGHMDTQVVDSIMRHEGATGTQGGRAEVYGFRQGNGNGYDEIMAARRQYGEGSPQEHEVVTRLLESHARQAGALDFTDPGMQAAVMSVAHMRGVGGAHAILNAMANGGDPQYSAANLDSGTAAALQRLTPQEFQDRLFDTRQRYDQIHYADPHSRHYDRTWPTYERGLTNRYNDERQEFLNMSHAGH